MWVKLRAALAAVALDAHNKIRRALMSFKPAFTTTLNRVTGINGAPASTVLYSAEPAAIWFSRGRSDWEGGTPVIVAQVAMALSRFFSPPGWIRNPPIWDPSYADIFQFTTLGTIPAMQRWSPVFSGVLWHGTADAHCRFDCTPYRAPTAALPVPPTDAPQSPFGTPLVGGRVATFDVYRPFGAAVPVLVAAPGTLWPDPYGGRGSYSGGNYYNWTDILDCSDTVDVRDGSSRASGLDTQAYSDGDEVRFPTGIGVSRYVVVRVYRLTGTTGVPFKRVLLMRDQAAWPGP
jgi:hypothetical protein